MKKDKNLNPDENAAEFPGNSIPDQVEQMLNDSKRFALKAEQLKKKILESPDQVENWKFLEELFIDYLGKDDWGGLKILELLGSMLPKITSNPFYLHFRAEFCISLKKYKNALVLYNQLIAMDPEGSYKMYMSRGHIKFELHESSYKDDFLKCNELMKVQNPEMFEQLRREYEDDEDDMILL